MVVRSVPASQLDSAASSLDAILSCGGDWDERRRIGAVAVKHRKPMVDIGAANFVGHLQVSQTVTFH